MSGENPISLPKKGEVFVGFSTQKGFVSWFIRWATACQASHSFLLYRSTHFSEHMVLEVQGRGFVQVPWHKWKTKNKLLALYEVEKPEGVIAEAFEKLGSRLGAAYDNFSLIGFLLIYVVPLWKKNRLDDVDKLVCSEMVARFLGDAKIAIHFDTGRVIPKDLWRTAAQNSCTFTERHLTSRGEKKLDKACKQGRDLIIDPEP